MSRFGLLVRQHGIDVLIGLAAVGERRRGRGHQRPRKAPTTTLWFAVPAAALLALPLLGRRRMPFAAPAAVWLLAASLSFVDGQLVPSTVSASLAGMGAALLLGLLRDHRQARLGLAIVIGGAAIIVYNTPDHSPGEFIFTPALFVIAWLAGVALRERSEQAEAADVRAAQAERERDAASRIAVAEERARIARELHDIVAHAVSVMVLQVGAVRHRLPDALGPDRGALQDVEQTGRTALTEMRHLLGALRRDGEAIDLAPQPGLDRSRRCWTRFAARACRWTSMSTGEPRALPPAIDLSAYRIVQEGLTNALKHARAGHADVDGPLCARRGADHGARRRRGASPGNDPGYGLAGMHERVKIYGGEMSAGSANGGGFVLRTSLPLDGGRP